MKKGDVFKIGIATKRVGYFEGLAEVISVTNDGKNAVVELRGAGARVHSSVELIQKRIIK